MAVGGTGGLIPRRLLTAQRRHERRNPHTQSNSDQSAPQCVSHGKRHLRLGSEIYSIRAPCQGSSRIWTVLRTFRALPRIHQLTSAGTEIDYQTASSGPFRRPRTRSHTFLSGINEEASMRRVVLVAAFTWAALFGLSRGAAAQEGASIIGLVQDTTGAVLPGVTVEATSDALIERVRSARHRRRGTLRDHQPAAGHLHRHLHAARLQNRSPRRHRARRATSPRR